MSKLDSGSKIAAFVTVGIGIILFVPAALNFVSMLSFVTGAERADAVFQGANAGDMPEFTFKTKQGQAITYQFRNESSAPHFHKGQTVAVLYDPRNPNHAKIDSPYYLWLATFVVGAPALLFILMGSLIFILGARRVNEIDELLDDTIE